MRLHKFTCLLVPEQDANNVDNHEMCGEIGEIIRPSRTNIQILIEIFDGVFWETKYCNWKLFSSLCR